MTHPTPESLGAYLDGELDAAARARVEAHLGTCAECSLHLADLAAVDQAARDLPVEAPAGYFDDFAPRVRARLETRASRRWRPPVWGWAAAAALLLGIVTPLVLQDRPLGVAQRAPAGAQDAPGDRKETAADAASSRVDALRYSELQKRNVPAPAPQPRLKEQPPSPAAAPKLAASANPPVGQDSIGGVAGGSAGERAAAARPSIVAAPAPEARVARRAAEADTLVLQEEVMAAEPAKDDAEASAGFAPAPGPASASSQRQYGPRGQNTVPAAPPARKAATEKTEHAAARDEDKDVDPTGGKSAEGRLVPTQEAVTVTGEPLRLSRGRESVKFRSLSRSHPRTDGEARTLREQWRTFAKENPDRPEADEARVRLVEAGVLAYQLGRKPKDRDIALADAREYLARTETPQAERIREALKALAP